MNENNLGCQLGLLYLKRVAIATLVKEEKATKQQELNLVEQYEKIENEFEEHATEEERHSFSYFVYLERTLKQFKRDIKKTCEILQQHNCIFGFFSLLLTKEQQEQCINLDSENLASFSLWLTTQKAILKHLRALQTFVNILNSLYKNCYIAEAYGITNAEIKVLFEPMNEIQEQCKEIFQEHKIKVNNYLSAPIQKSNIEIVEKIFKQEYASYNLVDMLEEYQDILNILKGGANE